MGIPGSLTSALQMLQRRSVPNAVPGVESPEFDVRSGEPLSGPLGPFASTPGFANPPTPYRPVDDPTSVMTPAVPEPTTDVRDGMPGTGLSHADTSSTLSSTPSGGSSAPPSGHGDDNDILTRIPRIQMPDINSMPQTEHINQLQAELDAARHPQVSGLRRGLNIAARVAPIALGAAIGGLPGAGGASEGVAQGLEEQHKHEVENQNQLLREIQEEQGARNQAYQAAGHVATTNAQLESNAILRDAMMRNQKDIAGGHDATRVTTTGMANDSRESIAADKMARQQDVDRANTELKAAQARLADARAAGVPAQIKLAEARVAASQQYADAAQRRAQVMEDSYERDTFGTQGGQPIPGMPTLPDSTGKPQVIGTKPYAASGPTGTTKTKMEQVDAINAVGPKLIQQIRSNASILGPFSGRAKNWEEFWGNLPPEAARIAGFQESFASLQPALHQFRSTTAKRDFERRLQIGSFKTNAEAMEAGVQAAMDSATDMKDAWAKGRGTGVPAGPGTAKPRSAPFAPPAPSVEQWERGPDGKLRRAGGR